MTYRLGMILSSTQEQETLYQGRWECTAQDGSAMVQWYNTKKIDSSPPHTTHRGLPREQNMGGETASSAGDMPSWDIVERARMATVSDYQIEVAKNNSMLLPKNVRKYLK
jgi:hypothetical protein